MKKVIEFLRNQLVLPATGTSRLDKALSGFENIKTELVKAEGEIYDAVISNADRQKELRKRVAELEHRNNDLHKQLNKSTRVRSKIEELLS